MYGIQRLLYQRYQFYGFAEGVQSNKAEAQVLLEHTELTADIIGPEL